MARSTSDNASDSLDIKHRESASRFSVRLGDDVAYLSYDRAGDNTLDYAHVWVPPAHRNKGIAAAITERALEYAVENGFSVIPSCPYVAAYVRRNKQYDGVTTSRKE